MTDGLVVLGYIFMCLFLGASVIFKSPGLAIAAAIWFVGAGLGIIAQLLEKQFRKPPVSQDPPEVRPIK